MSIVYTHFPLFVMSILLCLYSTVVYDCCFYCALLIWPDLWVLVKEASHPADGVAGSPAQRCRGSRSHTAAAGRTETSRAAASQRTVTGRSLAWTCLHREHIQRTARLWSCGPERRHACCSNASCRVRWCIQWLHSSFTYY